MKAISCQTCRFFFNNITICEKGLISSCLGTEYLPKIPIIYTNQEFIDFAEIKLDNGFYQRWGRLINKSELQGIMSEFLIKHNAKFWLSSTDTNVFIISIDNTFYQHTSFFEVLFLAVNKIDPNIYKVDNT